MYACEYCDKKFSTPQGKSQHKKICPKHPDKELLNKVNNLEEDIKQLQQQIALEPLPDKVSINKLVKENEKLKAQLHQLQARKKECFYQNILEKHFKATHKKLPIGITDITTDDTHVEIKRWNCWRDAFAQLILYNSHDPKEKLYACFFGEYTQSAKNLAIQSLKQQNITCFELMQTDNIIYMVNLDDVELCNNKEIVYTFDNTTTD
jgi:regulator of replication initiation timing